MGQSKNFQRRLFQKLQNTTQKFACDSQPRNDVVVRAKDDCLLDELNRQTLEKFQQIFF